MQEGYTNNIKKTVIQDSTPRHEKFCYKLLTVNIGNKVKFLVAFSFRSHYINIYNLEKQNYLLVYTLNIMKQLQNGISNNK